MTFSPKKTLLILILGIKIFFHPDKNLALQCIVLLERICHTVQLFVPDSEILCSSAFRHWPQKLSSQLQPCLCVYYLHPSVPHCGSVYRLLSVSHDCLTVSAREKKRADRDKLFQMWANDFPRDSRHHSTVSASPVVFCDTKGDSNILTSVKADYITMNSWMLDYF